MPFGSGLETFEHLVFELGGATSWWEPDRSTEVRDGRSYDDVGAVADTTVGGRWPVRFTTETIDVEPPKLIRVRYVGGAFRGTGTWTFTASEGGTEVAYRWRTTPSGALRRVFARFLPVANTHSANMASGFGRLREFLDRPSS